MTIHNKVIDHLNHVPTISVGISGTDINNQEEDISDSINHSPTNLLITAMSGWVGTWITKYFLWVVTIFQNPNPANAHLLRVQSAPNTNNFKFSLAAVEQLGACGASILHNLSSSVNLKNVKLFQRSAQVVHTGKKRNPPVLFSGKGRAPDAAP